MVLLMSEKVCVERGIINVNTVEKSLEIVLKNLGLKTKLYLNEF